MIFVRFIAFLGALMGLYAAAALQNGPDVTDANLCKLARRFSNSIPEQCISSLDEIGTGVAILFGLACLILLLWDFKAPVRAKCVQAIGWSGPRLKRASAKVEPHLILIGLTVAVIGMAIIGYGLLKKPQIATAATAAPGTDQPDPSRPSMLSGRKISGLEVVSRLERLEQEHAKTVSELATTKQQLESKRQELAAVTTANQPIQIKPRYNEDEIRKMIGVMGTLRDLVDKTIAPKTWAVGDLSQIWEKTLREAGPAATAAKVKELAQPMLSAHNQMNKILYDFQHYADRIRPVVDGFEVVGAFDGASNELASELQEYADAQNVNVAKIVFNRFAQWNQANQALGHWIGQTDARITAETKVLREWNP
jgi:hypothetical protein